MNEIEILLERPNEINFAPENIYQEIMQNIRTILTTHKFSVPLDRDLGLSAIILDEAMPKNMALLAVEITDAVKKYEPRARVTHVDFDGMSDGKFIPRVKVRILL